MPAASTTRKAAHWLVAGTDEFAVQQRAAALVREAMPHDPMNYEVIDGQADTIDAACACLARLKEALLTYPFFGGNKLVHLKKCSFLADTPVGRNEAVLAGWEDIAHILETLDPAQVQLIIAASGVDRRRSFFKAFSTRGQVEFFNLPDLGRANQARAYADQIAEMIRARGLQADPHVPELFVEMIGADTRTVASELDKLALYVHPERRIREEDLRAVVAATRESIIWELTDAVVRGDARESVHLLRQLLAQGESEVGINILLSQQVRLAAIGVYLLETKRLRVVKQGYSINVEVSPEGEALLPVDKKGDITSGFRLAKIVEPARKRSAARWFQGVELLHRTALQLVSSGGDRARILEAAVVKLCQL